MDRRSAEALARRRPLAARGLRSGVHRAGRARRAVRCRPLGAHRSRDRRGPAGRGAHRRARPARCAATAGRGLCRLSRPGRRSRHVLAQDRAQPAGRVARAGDARALQSRRRRVAAAAGGAGTAIHRRRAQPRAVPGRAVDGGVLPRWWRAPARGRARSRLGRAPARVARTRGHGAVGLARGAGRHRTHGPRAAFAVTLELFRSPPARADRRPRRGAAAVRRRRARGRLPRLPRRRPHRPALCTVPAGARRQRGGEGGRRRGPGDAARDGAVPRQPRRLGHARMAGRAHALQRPPAPDRGGDRAGQRLVRPRRVRPGQRRRRAQARGAAAVHAAFPAAPRATDPRRVGAQRPRHRLGGGGDPRREHLQSTRTLAGQCPRPDAGAARDRRRRRATAGHPVVGRGVAVRPRHQRPHRHRLPARDEGQVHPALRRHRRLQRRPHADRTLAVAAPGHGRRLLDRDHHLQGNPRLRRPRAGLQRDLRLATG